MGWIRPTAFDLSPPHYTVRSVFQAQQHSCCLSWSPSRTRGPVSEPRWRTSGSTRDTPRNRCPRCPTKTGGDLFVGHTTCQRSEYNCLCLCITRLRPEELNASVLTYMTETLNYSPSEITHTVTANRPSAIMASYHLLLHKFSRSQREVKPAKVRASSLHTLTDPDAAFLCFPRKPEIQM